MKKNRMMRLASLMLVMVLLTTCCISATFAKYTTDASAADTARVAKFGVAIETNGTLYSDAYAGNGTAPGTWTLHGDTKTVTVAAEKIDDNVVAPGTESYENGLYWGVTGTPEVTTKYYGEFKTRDIFLKAGEYAIMIPVKEIEDKTAYDAYAGRLYSKASGAYAQYNTEWNANTEATIKADFEAGNIYVITSKVESTEDYYPVVYALNSNVGGATYNKDTVWASSTEPIAKALTAQMIGNEEGVAYTQTAEQKKTTEKTWTVEFDDAKEIPTNTDLAAATGAKLGNEVITWAWAYGDKPVSITAAEEKVTDGLDTILGQMMAGASNEYEVVYYSSYNGGYVGVTYNKENNTVTDGVNTIFASLKTSFELKLRVTQVD